MKAKSIIFLLAILQSVCLAELQSIDFYTDGLIQDGNTYLVVRTFDNATVNMTGGLIKSYLKLYDTSVFNAYGGALGNGVCFTLFDSATLNLHKIDTFVAYGWASNMIEVAAGDNGQINFYGYGFEFEGNQLHGYWADGSSFAFMIRSNEETQTALVFHEIPEPTTFGILTLGAGVLQLTRRPRK